MAVRIPGVVPVAIGIPVVVAGAVPVAIVAVSVAGLRLVVGLLLAMLPTLRGAAIVPIPR